MTGRLKCQALLHRAHSA